MDIMQSSPFSVHPRLEGYNRRKAAGSPPVCFDIYVSKTNERPRRDPLLPQRHREKAVQQNPKTWMVSSQEKKKGKKHVVYHITQTHSRDRNPSRGGKEHRMHSKEQKDAVNCFDFFFSYKKAFYLFPWCECRARLKHLLMHWGLETTVVHRACLIHYTHNNYSEALEFEQPVTEHWALPQIKKKKYLHMMTFARSFRTPPPKSASATVQWVIRDPMGVH